MKSGKFIILVICVLFITSCGNEESSFMKDDLFIVQKVEKKKNRCYYYSSTRTMKFAINPCIIAPCGLYTVGDTVQLLKN